MDPDRPRSWVRRSRHLYLIMRYLNALSFARWWLTRASTASGGATRGAAERRDATSLSTPASTAHRRWQPWSGHVLRHPAPQTTRAGLGSLNHGFQHCSIRGLMPTECVQWRAASPSSLDRGCGQAGVERKSLEGSALRVTRPRAADAYVSFSVQTLCC